jgi:hypothetical protein
MTIGQSRSRGKIGESDERNISSIVSSDVCFHGLRNLSASLANRILPWDFSLKVTNNITRFHNHRNNESTRPNLLNTDRQRPKYIDDAKLNNRNKHSVSYITIRHAIPCLATLSHDPLSHDFVSRQTSHDPLSHDFVSRQPSHDVNYSVSYITIRTPCLTTRSHDPLSHDFVSRQTSHDPLSHDFVSRQSSHDVNYKLTILHRVDLHHRQQPVIQQRTISIGIPLGHDRDSRSKISKTRAGLWKSEKLLTTQSPNSLPYSQWPKTQKSTSSCPAPIYARNRDNRFWYNRFEKYNRACSKKTATTIQYQSHVDPTHTFPFRTCNPSFDTFTIVQ